MKNIILTWEQIFRKGAILAGVRPWYEYLDGKRSGKQLGLIYILVNRSGYDKINVKVRSLTPVITNDEIEASATEIFVKAEGFEGSLYNAGNTVAVSGKAEKVVLI